MRRAAGVGVAGIDQQSCTVDRIVDRLTSIIDTWQEVRVQIDPADVQRHAGYDRELQTNAVLTRRAGGLAAEKRG
jgi:hypothetical protein